MQDTTTITLPIPPDTLGIFAFAVLLVIGSYIIFLMLPPEPGTKHESPMQRMEESFGIKLESRLTAALLFVALFAYIMIFFAALIIAIRGLGGIVFDALPEVMSPTQPRVSLAFGTLLAAILGAPFLVWRTYVAAKQTAIAEESLFNDKINAAATDLAARRQVTRSAKAADGSETILTEWQDDLVTRAAAIDRLEGLALERADVAPRVARMLSIYVQELSREQAHSPKILPSEADFLDIWTWTQTLRPIVRTDMERAVQSLGRINPLEDAARIAFDPKNIDLRRCNLQGFDLRDLNFNGAQFGGASAQGVNFHRTNLQSAYLVGTKLQGAELIGANLKQTKLGESKLQGAVLDRANLMGANLFGAKLQGTHLIGTSLQGANLIWADFSEDTNLSRATTLRGAVLRLANLKSIAQLKPHWDDIFYSDEKLPDGHPSHWIAEDLDLDDLLTAWREWAATLDPPVTIAPDYNRTN